MPRSDPNIFSQKCGNGWEAVAGSISIVWDEATDCARSKLAERAATKKSSTTWREFRRRFARRILRLLKVPKKKCRGLGMPRPRKRKLEDEARLELDHPAGQAAWRLAELGVFHPILVRVEINWLSIEFVEGVEEVAAQLDRRALPDDLPARQT